MRVIAASAARTTASRSASISPIDVRPVAVGLGAAAVFFALALVRHLSFHSAAYDLGFFDQVLWNAAHGQGLRSTFLPYGFFGEHFEPALLIFTPFYVFAPSPLWLLAAQSLALGLTVVPLHALAGRLLDARGAWLAVAAYLLQLGVARAVATDFHTEALAVPFVFLALLLVVQARRLPFLLCAAVPLLCKEDGALVTIGIGLLAWLLTRRPITLVPVVLGLIYGAGVLLWVMPGLRHGAAGDLVLRYQYLGTTPSSVLLHVVTRPALWMGHLISSPAVPALLVMLAAVGFLALRRPAALAIALLPLIPALLSDDAYQSGLRLQYGLPAVPLLLVAALLGWQRLPVQAGGLALVAGAAVTWLALAPTVGSLKNELPELAQAGSVQSVLQKIPRDDKVAASTGLVAHLSERTEIWEFPAGFGVPWIVIDSRIAPSAKSLAAGYTSAVARLAAAGYRVDAQSAGVTLWVRTP